MYGAVGRHYISRKPSLRACRFIVQISTTVRHIVHVVTGPLAPIQATAVTRARARQVTMALTASCHCCLIVAITITPAYTRASARCVQKRYLSRVSTLTRDIDIKSQNLSVCP